MNKMIKRFTALVLSLVMILGCIPNMILDSYAVEPYSIVINGLAPGYQYKKNDHNCNLKYTDGSSVNNFDSAAYIDKIYKDGVELDNEYVLQNGETYVIEGKIADTDDLAFGSVTVGENSDFIVPNNSLESTDGSLEVGKYKRDIWFNEYYFKIEVSMPKIPVFKVDETIYGPNEFGLALSDAENNNETLYVLQDATIDEGEYIEINKSVTIMPKDNDVTLTLKTQIRLANTTNNISLRFGGDDFYELTIVADMDQRWFATRKGTIYYDMNTILDGENHKYSVDGPLVTIQNVSGQQGAVTISGAIIKNFYTTGNGGAIINSGSLNIFDESLIKDCYAEGNGGAIYNNYDGTVTVTDDSSILNCSALNGGGIYSVGTVAITSYGMIADCTARYTGAEQSGKGGGVYIYPETGSLIMDNNGIIYECSADKGGAIYLGSGSTFTNQSTTTELYKNTAYVLDTDKHDPAIFIHDGCINVTGLDKLQFIDNKLLTRSTTKKYKVTASTNGEKISGSGKKGSTRTITTIEGKKVASVIVTDKNGNEVDVTLNEDGTYSFVQPASNVDVQINYKNREITLNIGSTEASVDGETSNLDVAPILRNDRTMLPIRFVAENLGAKVDWDEKNPDKVIISRRDVKIEITLGSDIAKVNGKEFKLDSVAFSENDRTYLPVRFISEALNAIVEWNEARPNEVKIYEQ